MKKLLFFVPLAALLASCVTTPPPAWAAALNGVATEYPDAQYIPRRGRRQDLTSAQNDGIDGYSLCVKCGCRAHRGGYYLNVIKYPAGLKREVDGPFFIA
jgi:hypothetical protein